MRLLCLLLLVAFVSCEKDDPIKAPATPHQVQAEDTVITYTRCEEYWINYVEGVCSHGGWIDLYDFLGDTTLVIKSGNCWSDGMLVVVDMDCDILGYLGGAAGIMELNGVNYFDNSTFIGRVWQQ